jgi:hypothetical protein
MFNKLVSAASINTILVLLFLSLLTNCKKNYCEDQHGKVPYDLNVILRGEKIDYGLIAFRQQHDHIIDLDTKVFNLVPYHSYLLQRAVDSLDFNCTSTTWLTLGKGLQPEAITTDANGNGSAHLFRDVSAVPSGSTFDIHFQIIDASDSAVVLTSDCYQYQVK